MPLSLPRVMILGAAILLAACQSTPPASKESAQEEREKLASLNTQLAVEYMRDGDNELALKKLAKAVEADPNYVDAYNAYALVYAQLGETDKAEANFKRAVGIDPSNSSAQNNYGQFLCQRKRYDEGQARFLEAVKNPLYRSPEIAYSNAGTCAMQAQDPVAAEAHFRAALQIDPQLAPALLQMAQLSYDQGNQLGARGYLQRYLAVAPHNARSLWLGIRIENALGDKDAVSSYTMMLKNKFPDSQEAGLLQKGEFH